MVKFEARVKTKFGEILLQFENMDELKSALDALDVGNVENVVINKFGGFLSREPRQPKPGLEEIYRFTPAGQVELLKSPPSEPTTLGLLLYAYEPESVTSEEIFSISGIRAGEYIAQTAYKKYFDRTSQDRLVLTHAGRLWVETEIIAKLLAKSSADKGKES
jgi:hypothetical protein